METSNTQQDTIDKLNKLIATLREYLDSLLNNDNDDNEVVDSLGDTSFDRALTKLGKLERRLNRLITKTNV